MAKGLPSGERASGFSIGRPVVMSTPVAQFCGTKFLAEISFPVVRSTT